MKSKTNPVRIGAPALRWRIALLTVVGICCVSCASVSRVMGIEKGSIAITYYAPTWGPDEKNQEVVYFLKQVMLESRTEEMSRIYFCSVKPDGTERKEIGQLWKENPDQYFENFAVAVTMDVNAATKRAAIGVELGQRGGIFIVNLDGTGLRSLWPKQWKEDRPKEAGNPSWSPDGQWLAFQELREERAIYLYRIVKCRSDGSDYAPLTERDAVNYQPAWSPDGSQIAFVEDPKRHLCLMRPDGTEKRDTNAWGWHPRWSPDGKCILHDANQVIDPASGKRIRLYQPDLPLYPTWGEAGFAFCAAEGIGFTELDGKTTRWLLKNLSRGAKSADIESERFRW
jgi:dipeptidyl aminopeptidase/acylaminoacyl peptidase